MTAAKVHPHGPDLKMGTALILDLLQLATVPLGGAIGGPSAATGMSFSDYWVLTIRRRSDDQVIGTYQGDNEFCALLAEDLTTLEADAFEAKWTMPNTDETDDSPPGD